VLSPSPHFGARLCNLRFLRFSASGNHSTLGGIKGVVYALSFGSLLARHLGQFVARKTNAVWVVAIRDGSMSSSCGVNPPMKACRRSSHKVVQTRLLFRTSRGVIFVSSRAGDAAGQHSVEFHRRGQVFPCGSLQSGKGIVRFRVVRFRRPWCGSDDPHQPRRIDWSCPPIQFGIYCRKRNILPGRILANSKCRPGNAPEAESENYYAGRRRKVRCKGPLEGVTRHPIAEMGQRVREECSAEKVSDAVVAAHRSPLLTANPMPGGRF